MEILDSNHPEPAQAHALLALDDLFTWEQLSDLRIVLENARRSGFNTEQQKRTAQVLLSYIQEILTYP